MLGTWMICGHPCTFDESSDEGEAIEDESKTIKVLSLGKRIREVLNAEHNFSVKCIFMLKDVMKLTYLFVNN